MSVDAQELERMIRVQVELGYVRGDFERLSQRMDTLTQRMDTLSNHVDTQIGSLSTKIDTKVAELDSKIDHKFNWIIGILGTGLAVIIFGLGWIVVNDQHVSIQTNATVAAHRR